MLNIANRILEKINKEHAAIIPEEKYHEIISATNNKIGYIDGGHAEIFRSPSICVFFNRIFYTVYIEKRVQSKRIEFYSIAYADTDKKYNLDFIEPDFKIDNYEFSADDQYFTNAANIPSRIGELGRRLCELKIASLIDAEIIVLDGSFDAKHEYEKELMVTLENKNAIGFSKTCALVSDTGASIIPAIKNSSPFPKWYYNLRDNIFIAKLHEKAGYVFRVDVLSGDEKKIFPSLINNCRDPLLLGYPYALIEADKSARVSEKEKELFQLKLKAYLGKGIKDAEDYLHSLDTHEILDSIS